MERFFISIGGGDEIGGSSYFVQCNGKFFLFDAGIRYLNKRRYPSFSELLNLQTFDNFNDISGIFLSHAHYDHNGALPLLVTKLIGKKEIICSEYTKKFTEIQLNILKKHTDLVNYAMYEEVMVDRALGMLESYPLNKKIKRNGYDFTMYNAGHIPGAVMTLVEVDNTKILYTGDFSDKDYPLVEKYKLPIISDLDLLIVNATSLFKKYDNWEETWGDQWKNLHKILKEVCFLNQLNIKVEQVNTGLELAILIANELEESSFNRLGIEIYLDEPIYRMLDIIKTMEKKEFKNIKLYKDNLKLANKRVIYITLKNNKSLEKIKKIEFKYSLHESYEGIKNLILTLNPKKTLVVHYPKGKEESTLKEDLEKKGYYNCEYVVNEEIYEF